MPADDRLWAQNCNRAEDGREPTVEPNKQKAIGIAELWSLRYLPAKHAELLTKDTLAAHHAMPTMYAQRSYVAAGGLMSYAPSFAEAYRQAGIYAARILKGAKPADLPVVQSSKFELVINMKTAKALGIEVPNSMQLLADEVIE